MVYFTLTISMGLYTPNTTYYDIAPTMDEYTFTGLSIAEIGAKINKVFGNDRSWVDTAALDLSYYAATSDKVIRLAKWDNVIDNTTIPALCGL